jgi:hypothetical protein
MAGAHDLGVWFSYLWVKKPNSLMHESLIK